MVLSQSNMKKKEVPKIKSISMVSLEFIFSAGHNLKMILTQKNAKSLTTLTKHTA